MKLKRNLLTRHFGFTGFIFFTSDLLPIHDNFKYFWKYKIWPNLIKFDQNSGFDQIWSNSIFFAFGESIHKKKQNHTIQKHFKWLYLQDFAAQITLEAVYHKCNSWQKGYSLDKREPCSGPCLPRWWKPWSPRLLQWRVWKLTLAKRVQKIR